MPGEEMSTSQATEAFGIDAVSSWLEQRGVAFDVLEHRETFAAAREARAAGMAPEDTAKTIVLKGDEGYWLAVIPASQRLDIHKVRDQLEQDKHLRLATEGEIASDFPACEVGAVPPISSMFAMHEIIDSSLLGRERILCSGGDHRHSVLVAPDELVRATDCRTGSICEA